MVNVDGAILIHQLPEKVFDFVVDERNEPSYNPRMREAEQVTDGPVGEGTRFRAQVVSMGRPVEMVIEFTDFERPRRLGSATHMASMDLRGSLTFDPVAEGTRMSWSWQLEPHGVLKAAAPLLAWMGRRQEERIWTGLKKLLEEQTNPA